MNISGLSTTPKKVAILDWWLLVEVQLYVPWITVKICFFHFFFIIISLIKTVLQLIHKAAIYHVMISHYCELLCSLRNMFNHYTGVESHFYFNHHLALTNKNLNLNRHAHEKLPKIWLKWGKKLNTRKSDIRENTFFVQKIVCIHHRHMVFNWIHSCSYLDALQAYGIRQ